MHNCHGSIYLFAVVRLSASHLGNGSVVPTLFLDVTKTVCEGDDDVSGELKAKCGSQLCFV